MIKFKNPKDEPDFQKLHPKLKRVVDFMIAYAKTVLNHELTVTRIVEFDDSTHNQTAPYRFIDIRSNDLPHAEAEKMRTIVNLTFEYGKTSKGGEGQTIVPLDHSATSKGFTAEHFHVQVSSRENFG